MKMVRRRAEERLRFCTALLGRRPKSILEVGAAGGWFVQAFEELGVPASGIELDPVLVAQAQRRGANVLQADVTSWSPSGGVDVVWCSQTLEHIAAPRRAVCAMRDALNAGGLLEIDVPNGSSWGAMWRRLYTKPRVYGTIHAPHHQIAYRPCSLDRLLRSCDLDPLVLDERPTDDRIFGQVILPGSTLSRLAILGSHVLGHGYLLVSIARKPMGARSASQDGSNGS
jgi:SAM-dependent methyltransferase